MPLPTCTDSLSTGPHGKKVHSFFVAGFSCRATGPGCRMSDVSVRPGRVRNSSLQFVWFTFSDRVWEGISLLPYCRGRLAHARGFADKFRFGPVISDMRKHVPPVGKKLCVLRGLREKFFFCRATELRCRMSDVSVKLWPVASRAACPTRCVHPAFL